MKNIISTRFVSILFSILAVMCPFVLLMTGFFNPPKSDRPVCGLYILLPMAKTVLLMGLLSFTALVFGVRTYRRTSRSAWHKLEVVLVSVPFLFVLAFIILFVLEDAGIIETGLI